MSRIRTISRGVSANGDPVTIRFGSKSIATMAGQSVMAAMAAAGEMVCRTTATGTQRGMFCGMGVCQDCLVEIDGASNQRACMTQVRDGMVVRQQFERSEPPSVEVEPETIHLSPEVLVIGGGPAGLAAAAVAAEAGLDVLLVDERVKLGGQYYKQPADGFEIDEKTIDKQFRRGRALIQRFVASGATYITGVSIWGAFGPGQIIGSNQTSTYDISPQKVVLATGAYERGVPLPGWTLPGFVTTGAVQTLLRSYQIVPGKRILIGGNGPLNLQVAAELVRAGVEVVALVEAAQSPGLRSALSMAKMLAAAPDLVRDGLTYQSVLRKAGTPTFHRHVIARAEGTNAVERAVIARVDDRGMPVLGTEKTFDVDMICNGFGFLPSNEIARSLGCRHHYDPSRRSLVAERDERGRSSLSQVWIAGDAAGLGGARIAEAGGVIAGSDIASELKRQPRNRAELEASQRTVVRSKKFQSALWTLFRAPAIVDQLATPETIVCRCENITLGVIRSVMSEGLVSAGAVKRLTRAGMGRCQGRYCGTVVVELVSGQSGVPVGEMSFYAPRVPFKPVSIGMIAEK